MTSGHVFVLRANILNLHADAWMLPTDAWLNIEKSWVSDAYPGLQVRAQEVAPAGFGDNDCLAFPITGYAGKPLAVATAVPSDNRWTADAVRCRVHAFADAALHSLEDADGGSARRLLAIPFLGSAGGFARDLTGQMAALLEASREVASQKQVDVAVVLRDPAGYTLAQTLRRAEPSIWWPEMAAGMRQEAERLGVAARSGRVVPFLGAGVSMSAGAPSWKDLLADLAATLGLSPTETESLGSLNPLDQASLLETMYSERGVTPGFRDSIASRVDLPRYGIAPALLASLPSEGAITLNYDRLFERACRDAGAPRFVIPHDSGSGHWLLKLHGDAKHPETIVLTRDDYLGFNANREALSSLVKAHLMTHHLLFVGFGLADDHFHEIIHAVRRAIPGGGHGIMGTALMVATNSLQAKAWEGRLAVVSMAKENDAGDLDETARDLEIFLDAMMAHATQEHRYLLAEKYGESLDPEDQQLREDLLALVARHDAGDSSVWLQVREALERFGLPANALPYRETWYERVWDTPSDPNALQYNVTAMTTPGLLRLYAHVLRELLARRIIRTKNAPAGDYAEYLTQVVLGGGLAAPSVKSYDVITADHRRIQVKARLADATAAEKRVQFSAFRSWDFDEAISIVFNEDDYRVLWAISVPAESLRAASRNQTWVNADTVVRSRSQLASLPGAEDLTVAFRQAVAQLEASIQSTPD